MRDSHLAIESGQTYSNQHSIGPAWGFRLVPGRLAGAAKTVRPGSYPIDVSIDNGSPITVSSDSARVLAAQCSQIRLLNGVAGDSWKVEIFESPREVIMPGQPRTIATNVVAAGTALTAGPPAGSNGWEVRPNYKTWTFYAGGTPQVCRLWVCSASGNWVDTGDDLDFTINAVISRSVLATASRIFLAGTTQTVEVDAEIEVG